MVDLRLRLLGEIHEGEGAGVTGVTVAAAFDDDAVGADFFFVRDGGDLDGHFGPQVERLGRMKLDAALPEIVFAGTERERGFRRLNVEGIEVPCGGNVFCTHKILRDYHSLPRVSEEVVHHLNPKTEFFPPRTRMDTERKFGGAERKFPRRRLV